MSLNLGLFIRNLMKLVITIIITQILSVGFYHFYNYLFDDYVSEAKVVSSCFDTASSCELTSSDSNIKNFADYVQNREILETVVNNIETSTGKYLSYTEVRDSITVESKEGYLVLKIKSDDSYLSNEIYDNLITEVFSKTNVNEVRYTVVDYSLHEIVSLIYVKQIGLLMGVFITFITISSSSKKVSNSILGGITVAKNKMKQNIIITIITIGIFALVGSGIYYGHKTLFKTYKIETKYTFVCNDPETCDFDNVNELYNALKSNTSKNSTVTSIVDSVSETSKIHLSTQDVENSFDLKLSNDVIVLTVENKDTLVATYINDTITNTVFKDIETQEDINLRQLDSDFSETPKFSAYLLTSTVLGSVTALLLISSELSVKKPKKSTAKTNGKE